MVQLFPKTRPHDVSAKVFVSCRSHKFRKLSYKLRGDERSPRGFYFHTYLKCLYLSNGKRYLREILYVIFIHKTAH